MTLKDIPGQLSTLIIVIESQRIKGAWTAGGEPTVRGLDIADKPYLGNGAQFGGLHGLSTNALFADGSARSIHSSIAPAVLEANVTPAAGVERLVE